MRFVLAGAINTGVGYGLFLLALTIAPNTLSALVVATIAAILFNFLSLGSFVFRSTDPRRLWRFVVAYGAVFLFNAAALNTFEHVGIPPVVGGLLAIPAAAGLSFVVCRRYVFLRAGPTTPVD